MEYQNNGHVTDDVT